MHEGEVPDRRQTLQAGEPVAPDTMVDLVAALPMPEVEVESAAPDLPWAAQGVSLVPLVVWAGKTSLAKLAMPE